MERERAFCNGVKRLADWHSAVKIKCRRFIVTVQRSNTILFLEGAAALFCYMNSTEQTLTCTLYINMSLH